MMVICRSQDSNKHQHENTPRTNESGHPMVDAAENVANRVEGEPMGWPADDRAFAES
jgi:hypothetical protein